MRFFRSFSKSQCLSHQLLSSCFHLSNLYAFMLRRKPSPGDGETSLHRGLQQFLLAVGCWLRWLCCLLTTFGCGLSAWLLNFNYCYIFHTPHTTQPQQRPRRKWQWGNGQREWEMEMGLKMKTRMEKGKMEQAFVSSLLSMLSVDNLIAFNFHE